MAIFQRQKNNELKNTFIRRSIGSNEVAKNQRSTLFVLDNNLFLCSTQKKQQSTKPLRILRKTSMRMKKYIMFRKHSVCCAIRCTKENMFFNLIFSSEYSLLFHLCSIFILFVRFWHMSSKIALCQCLRSY